jgi:hypothetical protein
MQCAGVRLSSAACPALYYLTSARFFLKELLHIKCVFLFSLRRLSEIFLILERTERDMFKNVYWFNVRTVHYQT